MFTPVAVLAILAAQSTLITAFPSPESSGNNAPAPVNVLPQSISNNDIQPQSASNVPTATGTPLYVITSANIHQYSGPPAPSKKRLRRQTPMADGTLNLTNTISSMNSLDVAPTPGAEAIARPTTMEDFNITVVSGADNTHIVHCNVTWDAGAANSGTRDHIANEPFTCDDGRQTVARMERRNVTPLYGFYIFVKMPGVPEATWMVKDLNSAASQAAGWTGVASDMTFKGQAILTQAANQTLADFLAVPVPAPDPA